MHIILLVLSVIMWMFIYLSACVSACMRAHVSANVCVKLSVHFGMFECAYLSAYEYMSVCGCERVCTYACVLV